MQTLYLTLVKTLANLSRKIKAGHFYLKTLNISCQNMSGVIANAQLNVGNDVDPSNMKVFEQNPALTVGGIAATWDRNLKIFIFVPIVPRTEFSKIFIFSGLTCWDTQ